MNNCDYNCEMLNMTCLKARPQPEMTALIENRMGIGTGI